MSQADFPTGLGRTLGPDTPPPPHPARLNRLLRSATRKRRTAKLVALLLGGFACLLITLLAGVALDAALGLPPWGLIAIDVVLLAVAGGIFIQCLKTAARSRHDARRAAVAMEQRGGIESSRLINALDLSSADETIANRMSPTLRNLAVERGDNAVARLDDRALVDRPERRKAWWGFAAAVVVASAAWLAMPGVFSAVGPRLLSPLSGLPAYTTLRFDVAVGPEVIHVGKPGVVEVTLSREVGRRALPGEADVVVVDDDGQTRRSPMHRSFREGDVLPSPPEADANAETPDVPTRFSLRFERIDGPMAFYIDTPGGRSQTFTITPDTTPLFKSLHATVTPPDYAGLAATTQRLEIDESGGVENVVRALHGSAITLTATSNVTLAEAQLALEPNRPPLAFANAAGGRDVEALFIVDQSSEAEFELVGGDGKRSAAVPIKINTLDDRAPSVDIHRPEPMAFAVEGYPVPIRVAANDDVGVASLRLHLNVAEQDAEPIELAPLSTSPEGPARRVAVTHELDLASLGAKPGDVIRYFATAHDGLPFALGGPPHDAGQLAETPVHQIQIISQAEWEELARTQYGLEQMQAEVEAFMAEMQKLADMRTELMEQLAALQEKLAAGEPLNDMQRQQMRDLQDQLDAFAEEAQALADAMNERANVESLYEFEEPYKQRLRELAKQLERQAELAEAMKDAAAPMAGTPDEAAGSGESRDGGEAADGKPNPSGETTLPNGSSPPPGSRSTPSKPGDNKPTPPGLAFRGVTPTQVDEFLEQAERMAEEDEPFDEATQEEMEELEEDLLRLELAEEMLFHAERIGAVIVGQREVETKLGELRFRDPDQLSPDEALRIVGYSEQQSEMREELEDAALMLRESAELAGPLLPNMSGSSIVLTEKLDGLYVYPDMEAVGEYADALESALAHASAQIAADKLETLLSDASNMPGQAESDLDGCLSLPRANLQSALQQMAGARAAGAMGQLSGSQGQRGRSGSAGGRSNASLIGPRSMGNAPSNAGTGRDASGRSNAAHAADGLDPETGRAETLNPESANTRGRAAIALPGVPARYQDVAAAYFQRLADEAARETE